MRKKIFLFLFTIGFVQLNAQFKKQNIFVEPRISLLNGDNAVSTQIQLGAGYKKKKWGAGVGAAIDYYQVRSVPVFLAGYFYPGNSGKFSFYADAGINIAWATDRQYNDYRRNAYWQQTSDFMNGWYGAIGFDYRFLQLKNQSLYIGAGYSVKTVTDSYSTAIYNPILFNSTWTSQKDMYQFNRLSIHLGLHL